MDSQIPKSFAGERPFLMGRCARIVSNELTESLGLAGKTGIIFGQTVPSSSGVTDVIGMSEEDCAINVGIDDTDDSYWLAEHLVEVLDTGEAQISFRIGEA